jgi:type VI secretion system protein VasJ
MTFRNDLSARYLKLATQPVSAESFVGRDIRFNSEYEVIERELAKAQSLYATGQVDWPIVRELCEEVLTRHSKDLRVAAWLAWALHQCESFVGLLAGLRLLEQLCSAHWQDIHPQKMRTRAAGIGWLVGRVDGVLTDAIPLKEQLPLFQALHQCLQALDLTLTSQLGDEAPLILPIRRRLAAMIQRVTEGQHEQAAVSSVLAQVKEAAGHFLSPGSMIDNEKDAHKALRAQQENAQPLCSWWLRQKATDLRALRLNRTLMWLGIEGLPERTPEQLTGLRGLPADKLKAYQERLERGDYADLLLDVESSLARAPFWLDGQRMAWECLQALKAEMAMREVEFHFALFLQRLPGVVELRFHDTVPFADVETRAWINAHVLVHVQAPQTLRKAENSDTQPVWEKALQDVLPMLRRDGLKVAVQVLKQGLQKAQSGRARFFWQLSLARLCFVAKKYDLARSQLEVLDRQLQGAAMQAWEPDVALEVLHLLHNCFELLPQSPSIRERKEEVHRRLCHLDLETVLE